MICALLAVLELVRLQAVVLTQSEMFGAILLRKHKMFDVVFSGGKSSIRKTERRDFPAGERMVPARTAGIGARRIFPASAQPMTWIHLI